MYDNKKVKVNVNLEENKKWEKVLG
jgi:hypothetical protein